MLLGDAHAPDDGVTFVETCEGSQGSPGKLSGWKSTLGIKRSLAEECYEYTAFRKSSSRC
jgi:hypothetical protein